MPILELPVYSSDSSQMLVCWLLLCLEVHRLRGMTQKTMLQPFSRDMEPVLHHGCSLGMPPPKGFDWASAQ
ncbi:hypothetical protein DM02DRAFT_608090 [Periconia macrospinosa]|uniref:Uncharacterized protein n=1 Tax=Periconia macrospinosa TaxID=97972 RepID=A0A2V1EDY1_9PLEO|nr:hypothetical protein DM02DRAFT_608090 [Periconia macrospinosa]